MAEPIRVGLVNRPLTCEEHDANIDALLNRANHTGTQTCDTIDPVSLNSCVANTSVVSGISQDVTLLDNRIITLEQAIQGGGTIQQDIQALRNELLNEINQAEVVINSNESRISTLEIRADGFDSSISSINGSIAFEVGQLQDQINTNLASINAINTLNANQTNLINSNTSAINQEAANRTNAINTVNTSITNESANRIAGDSNLQTNLNTEINNRISGDNGLQNQITTQVGLLQAEDIDIRNDFASADSSLQAQINAINSGLNSIVPTGTVVMWAGVAIPTGWLLCDGQLVSRSTYAALFSIIGTQYGTTNSSNFRTPNFNARFPKGLDSQTSGNQGGSIGGDNSIVLTSGNLPAHSHTVNLGSHSHTANLQHFHGVNPRSHTHAGGGGGAHTHRLGRNAPLRERTDNSSSTKALCVEDADPDGPDFTIGAGGLYPITESTTVGTAISSADIQIYPPGETFAPGNRTDNALSTSQPINSTNLGTVNTGSTGGTSSFDNRPSFINMKFIIKA